MRFLSLLTLAILAVSPICAKQYLGVHFGTDSTYLTKTSNSGSKVGFKAGANYGYVFESGFRAELEVAFRQHHYNTKYDLAGEDDVKAKHYRSMHSWAYMGNVLYDITTFTEYNLVPYVGVGFGYAHNTEKNKVKTDDATKEDKLADKRFAYQGIAGVKYNINELLAVGAEYCYFCGKSHAKDHSVALHLIRSF